MGKPVNLNRYGKEMTRAVETARTGLNAMAFGQTKAEKEIVKLKQDKSRRDLGNHELDE